MSQIKIFAQTETCNTLGMNLYFTSYWSREVPFANLMMQSSPWVPCDSNWQYGQSNNYLYFNSIVKDKQGYPTHLPQTINGLSNPQAVQSILSWDNGGILPIGTYQLIYDGDGEIELFGNDTITILNSISGRIDFNLKPNKIIVNEPGKKGGSLGLIIRRSNKDNPINNIRVLLPNTSQNIYPFNPAFLEQLKPFKSIRFMNWNAAYWSDEINWEDRRKPDYYTQFNSIDWYSIDQKGVAIEYAIQLCNILKKDMWISIPYKANENYITELGKLILSTLDPTLNIYIEYGNEVWNEGFSDVPNDAFERQHNFVNLQVPANLINQNFQYKYAYFANKAFKSFNPSNNNRVIRVLAGQQGSWQGDVLQRSIDGMNFIGSKDGFDVGSVTDYIYHDEAIKSLPVGATVQDVALAFRNIMNKSIASISENLSILNAIGKKMITYEGGVHATCLPGDPNEQAIIDFSKDTSFYNISTEWLKNVGNLNGIQLQMAFVLADDQYGYWHLQNIFDPNPTNSLKYKALINYCKTVDNKELSINNNPKVYPNPFYDELSIEFENENNLKLKIIDSQGKIYFTENYENKQIINLSISNLPKGLYFLCIESNLKVYNQKILKL